MMNILVGLGIVGIIFIAAYVIFKILESFHKKKKDEILRYVRQCDFDLVTVSEAEHIAMEIYSKSKATKSFTSSGRSMQRSSRRLTHFVDSFEDYPYDITNDEIESIELNWDDE